MRIELLGVISADIWVFDNDGTLYQDTKGIESAIVSLMNRFIAQLYGVDSGSAYQKRKELLAKHKTKYTLIALKNEGINEDEFIRSTYLAVDPKDYGISPNPRLRELISSLAGEKIVLTNNPSAFAKHILSALGIEDLFCHVYGIQELRFFQKPAQEAFMFLNSFLCHGKTLVCIDDEVENLKTARLLGCITVLIGNNHLESERSSVDFWMPSLI